MHGSGFSGVAGKACALAAGGLLLSALTPNTALAGAAVHVHGGADCLDPTEARARLGEVVARHPHASELMLTVTESAREGGVRLSLRGVTALGYVVLERDFDIEPTDCGSGPDLLALSLDTFLSRLPEVEWQGVDEGVDLPAPAEPPEAIVAVVEAPRAKSRAGLDLSVYASGGGRARPLGGDAEGGVILDVGSHRHGLTGSVALAVAWPRRLGPARFLETYGLMGLGWRYGTSSWLLRLGMRSGGLLVVGYGLPTSRRAWLPWLEIEGTLLWRGRRVRFGPRLGVSPLTHQVAAGEHGRTRVPAARVSLVVALPFWGRTF